MKIALAQFNPTVGDFEGNSARILQIAQQAKSRGAELAVYSELCLCGYLPQDLLERPAFIERNREALALLARTLPLPAIIGYAGRAHEINREAGRQLRGACRRWPYHVRAAKNAASRL